MFTYLPMPTTNVIRRLRFMALPNDCAWLERKAPAT